MRIIFVQRSVRELAIEIRDEARRIRIGLLDGVDSRTPKCLDESVLKRPVHALDTPFRFAEGSSGGLEVETLDITDPRQIAALRERLTGRLLDILFVNAGTTAQDANGLQAIGSIEQDEFVRVMVTNALSPMRVIEALQDRVPRDGLIGAMSSGQGSISNNERGSRELYRGSKAALNMFLRSFAARERENGRAMVLLAPGWIRTELGGPDAPFTIEESAPRLVDVLLAKRDRPGLEYLDRDSQVVPW